MADGQSGKWIHDTFVQLGCTCAFFDWRKVTQDRGVQGMNKELLNAINILKPNLTLVVKGLGISGNTIKEMKKIHEQSVNAIIIKPFIAYLIIFAN